MRRRLASMIVVVLACNIVYAALGQFALNAVLIGCVAYAVGYCLTDGAQS